MTYAKSKKIQLPQHYLLLQNRLQIINKLNFELKRLIIFERQYRLKGIWGRSFWKYNQNFKIQSDGFKMAAKTYENCFYLYKYFCIYVQIYRNLRRNTKYGFQKFFSSIPTRPGFSRV